MLTFLLTYFNAIHYDFFQKRHTFVVLSLSKEVSLNIIKKEIKHLVLQDIE